MENSCWIVLCCGMFASTEIAAPSSVSHGLPTVLPASANFTYETVRPPLSSVTRAVEQPTWKPRRIEASGDLFASFKLNCPLRKVCRSARKRFQDAPSVADELCAVNGKSVQWFKKTRKESKKLSSQDERIGLKGKRLLFQRLLESDSGKYVCTGADTSTELAVIDLSVKATPREVHFTERPTQANLLQRSHSLVLRCTAGGYPTPTVYWLKHFRRVATSGRVHADDGTLHIENAQHEDTAVYRCVADNQVHRHIVATSKVYVY